jgi:hypothetical protein
VGLYAGTYTTDGFADCTTITWDDCAGAAAPAAGGGASSTVTFCSPLVFRLPLSYALRRSRCTASMTAFRSARNASPSFTVQSSFSLIMVRTWGKSNSDFTLGSHVSLFSSSGESLSFGFCFAHRSACTTSSG